MAHSISPAPQLSAKEMPFNIKTQKQSRRIQEAAPELKKIERKYANRTDQEAMILKGQETMAVYQKYKISPLFSIFIEA